MEPLSQLLATTERETLQFFFSGLKDVSDEDVDPKELLYTASVLAHHALVSTEAPQGVPAPDTLTDVLDTAASPGEVDHSVARFASTARPRGANGHSLLTTT